MGPVSDRFGADAYRHFLLSSIQLFFIGILGEYIGAIYTQVRERPLVIEKERVNFSMQNTNIFLIRHGDLENPKKLFMMALFL